MKGLYQRYQVTRIDGEEDHPDTAYFVLKVSPGKAWDLAAIAAYSEALLVAEKHLDLYADLRSLIKRMKEQQTRAEL